MLYSRFRMYCILCIIFECLDSLLVVVLECNKNSIFCIQIRVAIAKDIMNVYILLLHISTQIICFIYCLS